MLRWKGIALIAVAVFAVIGGCAYYWLIDESHMPSDANFDISVTELRRLAEQIPGDKVLDIQVEKVAAFTFPATAIVAGDGWDSREVPVYSYQLSYPDDTTGIIDTGLNETQGTGSLTFYDDKAFARVQAALGKAKFILLTHEHVDHIGGLTVYPHIRKILPAIYMTKEQYDHPERSLPAEFTKGALNGFKPLVYDKYKAIAPGVVLIKAPGHSPGSQMIYVRKVDGTEVLFLGDVAWQMRNVETMRERPRLITHFFLKEDRHAVFGELKALAHLHVTRPTIAMVPGHDGQQVDKLIAEGVLSDEFEQP